MNDRTEGNELEALGFLVSERTQPDAANHVIIQEEVVEVFRTPERKDVGDLAPIETELPGHGEQPSSPATIPPAPDDD